MEQQYYSEQITICFNVFFKFGYINQMYVRLNMCYRLHSQVNFFNIFRLIPVLFHLGPHFSQTFFKLFVNLKI